MSEQEDLFGPVISTYTSEQAIEDGFLCQPYPNKFPGWCFTAGVHAAIEAKDDGRTYAQKAIPLLMDAAMIVRAQPGDHLYTKGLFGNVTDKEVWIGANELGGFTLMFPDEY
jgi:hypothetical protein